MFSFSSSEKRFVVVLCPGGSACSADALCCVVLCCGQRLSAWMEGALLIRCELFFQVPRSCSEDTGNR